MIYRLTQQKFYFVALEHLVQFPAFYPAFRVIHHAYGQLVVLVFLVPEIFGEDIYRRIMDVI